MAIINFKSTKKDAFKDGFMKGLCAPLMLVGDFEMPEIIEPKKIIPSSPADDARKMAEDFRIAVANVIKDSE